MQHYTVRTLRNFSEFETRHPELAGRMRWIHWRSKPVKRTRKGNGDDRIVEELEPNGFAEAFVKIAGRWYIDEAKFWQIVELQNGRDDAS